MYPQQKECVSIAGAAGRGVFSQISPNYVGDGEKEVQQLESAWAATGMRLDRRNGTTLRRKYALYPGSPAAAADILLTLRLSA